MLTHHLKDPIVKVKLRVVLSHPIAIKAMGWGDTGLERRKGIEEAKNRTNHGINKYK